MGKFTLNRRRNQPRRVNRIGRLTKLASHKKVKRPFQEPPSLPPHVEEVFTAAIIGRLICPLCRTPITVEDILTNAKTVTLNDVERRVHKICPSEKISIG